MTMRAALPRIGLLFALAPLVAWALLQRPLPPMLAWLE
jgi:hypothetical protein